MVPTGIRSVAIKNKATMGRKAKMLWYTTTMVFEDSANSRLTGIDATAISANE